MRTIFALSTAIFLIFSLFFNCSSTSKRSRKPVTSIEIGSKSNRISHGAQVTVHCQAKVKDGIFKQSELFINGQSVYVSKAADFSFQLDSRKFSVGTQQLKVVSTKEDGVSGENFCEIMILSDITPIKYTYRIIKSIPHPVTHFTQGLEIHDNVLYEGTGQEGSSAIFKYDLKNWKIFKEIHLENQYFGEGITLLNHKLYQLTYKSKIGFVRDPDNLEVLKTWSFPYAEGWGLANDGKSLLMSDGTENIYYLDPETLKEIKRIQVCNTTDVVKNLNELEYINGEIWANLWTTDMIVRIDPNNGKIVGEIDLKGILSPSLVDPKNPVDVLNGIAYDNTTGKLYVTGKLWPKIFEIELIKK